MSGLSAASGCVVWVTGLPSSGKSTLAARLRARLLQAGRCCTVLDGDAVREALVPRPGYTPEARDAFYATLAGLAGLLARDGALVIVAATAHKRGFRERARSLAPRFLEVFVDVDPTVCAERDAKGLFAASRAGQLAHVPGAGASYERPVAPDVTARGGHDDEALTEILRRIDADAGASDGDGR